MILTFVMCFYYLACSFSFLIFFEVELIYTVSVALYNVTDFCCTTVIQLCIYIYIILHVIFHFGLSQDTEHRVVMLIFVLA